MSANLQREDPFSLRPYKWILNDLQMSTFKARRGNRNAHIRHLWRKIAISKCHRYLFFSSIEKYIEILIIILTSWGQCYKTILR